MCGRYSLTIKKKALLERFQCAAGGAADHEPRFNIAPTQEAPAILLSGGGRRLVGMRWGLLPPWADNPNAAGFINARAETVRQKASFRRLLERHRVLIPADGFYEWRGEPGGGHRQPVRFVLRSRAPFGLAGLWDRWAAPGAEPRDSFTILTTLPNEVTAPVHDRMPVMLRPGDEAAWLDPECSFSSLPADWCAPYPAAEMEAYAVSPAVNSARHEAPDCVEPAGDTGLLL